MCYMKKIQYLILFLCFFGPTLGVKGSAPAQSSPTVSPDGSLSPSPINSTTVSPSQPINALRQLSVSPICGVESNDQDTQYLKMVNAEINILKEICHATKDKDAQTNYFQKTKELLQRKKHNNGKIAQADYELIKDSLLKIIMVDSQPCTLDYSQLNDTQKINLMAWALHHRVLNESENVLLSNACDDYSRTSVFPDSLVQDLICKIIQLLNEKLAKKNSSVTSVATNVTNQMFSEKQIFVKIKEKIIAYFNQYSFYLLASSAKISAEQENLSKLLENEILELLQQLTTDQLNALKDEEGHSLFVLAVKYNCFCAVKFLIEQKKVRINLDSDDSKWVFAFKVAGREIKEHIESDHNRLHKEMEDKATAFERNKNFKRIGGSAFADWRNKAAHSILEKQRNKQAINFAHTHVKKNVLATWNEFAQNQKKQRIQFKKNMTNANQLYKHNLLQRMFSQWKKYKNYMCQPKTDLIEKADTFVRTNEKSRVHNLAKKGFVTWKEKAQTMRNSHKLIREKLASDIARYKKCCTLAKIAIDQTVIIQLNSLAAQIENEIGNDDLEQNLYFRLRKPILIKAYEALRHKVLVAQSQQYRFGLELEHLRKGMGAWQSDDQMVQKQKETADQQAKEKGDAKPLVYKPSKHIATACDISRMLTPKELNHDAKIMMYYHAHANGTYTDEIGNTLTLPGYKKNPHRLSDGKKLAQIVEKKGIAQWWKEHIESQKERYLRDLLHMIQNGYPEKLSAAHLVSCPACRHLNVINTELLAKKLRQEIGGVSPDQINESDVIQKILNEDL